MRKITWLSLLLYVVTLWPLGLVVHLLGIEPFELPQNWKEWLGIGINVSLVAAHISLITYFCHIDACDILK